MVLAFLAQAVLTALCLSAALAGVLAACTYVCSCNRSQRQSRTSRDDDGNHGAAASSSDAVAGEQAADTHDGNRQPVDAAQTTPSGQREQQLHAGWSPRRPRSAVASQPVAAEPFSYDSLLDEAVAHHPDILVTTSSQSKVQRTPNGRLMVVSPALVARTVHESFGHNSAAGKVASDGSERRKGAPSSAAPGLAPTAPRSSQGSNPLMRGAAAAATARIASPVAVGGRTATALKFSPLGVSLAGRSSGGTDGLATVAEGGERGTTGADDGEGEWRIARGRGGGSGGGQRRSPHSRLQTPPPRGSGAAASHGRFPSGGGSDRGADEDASDGEWGGEADEEDARGGAAAARLAAAAGSPIAAGSPRAGVRTGSAGTSPSPSVSLRGPRSTSASPAPRAGSATAGFGMQRRPGGADGVASSSSPRAGVPLPAALSTQRPDGTPSVDVAAARQRVRSAIASADAAAWTAAGRAHVGSPAYVAGVTSPPARAAAAAATPASAAGNARGKAVAGAVRLHLSPPVGSTLRSPAHAIPGTAGGITVAFSSPGGGMGGSASRAFADARFGALHPALDAVAPPTSQQTATLAAAHANAAAHAAAADVTAQLRRDEERGQAVAHQQHAFDASQAANRTKQLLHADHSATHAFATAVDTQANEVSQHVSEAREWFRTYLRDQQAAEEEDRRLQDRDRAEYVRNATQCAADAARATEELQSLLSEAQQLVAEMQHVITASCPAEYRDEAEGLAGQAQAPLARLQVSVAAVAAAAATAQQRAAAMASDAAALPTMLTTAERAAAPEARTFSAADARVAELAVATAVAPVAARRTEAREANQQVKDIQKQVLTVVVRKPAPPAAPPAAAPAPAAAGAASGGGGDAAAAAAAGDASADSTAGATAPAGAAAAAPATAASGPAVIVEVASNFIWDALQTVRAYEESIVYIRRRFQLGPEAYRSLSDHKTAHGRTTSNEWVRSVLPRISTACSAFGTSIDRASEAATMLQGILVDAKRLDASHAVPATEWDVARHGCGPHVAFVCDAFISCVCETMQGNYSEQFLVDSVSYTDERRAKKMNMVPYFTWGFVFSLLGTRNSVLISRFKAFVYRHMPVASGAGLCYAGAGDVSVTDGTLTDGDRTHVRSVATGDVRGEADLRAVLPVRGSFLPVKGTLQLAALMGAIMQTPPLTADKPSPWPVQHAYVLLARLLNAAHADPCMATLPRPCSAAYIATPPVLLGVMLTCAGELGKAYKTQARKLIGAIGEYVAIAAKKKGSRALWGTGSDGGAIEALTSWVGGTTTSAEMRRDKIVTVPLEGHTPERHEQIGHLLS